ncbi:MULTISPECIES: cytochrome P450 [Demequina]|uniref:cytochrome P450 n=1 Tax=Demequina TaxID=577469 RepID=UPI0007842B32|nr:MULTISPECIES: cytochrome P450 [Demequina]
MTPTTATAVPTSDVDPFSPEFLEDPWPFVTALRETAPVVHLPRHDVYAIGRYEDVHCALTDWQSLQSSAGVGLANFHHEKPWRPPSVLLEADPPRHDAPRYVLQEILSPRRLRALEERWRADARVLVDAVLERGTTFDAVTELAEAFPLRVFPDAVGLGPDGRENLLPYGDFAFNAFGPQEGLVAKAQAGIGPTIAWIGEQCRRENLAPEGFGAEIWASADRGDITPEQAPLMVRSLLTAGVDTTVTGIAAVVHAVSTTPGAWERLRAQPALLPRAFEEAVRLQSPVQTFFRTTRVPTTIARITLEPDRKVLMFLGAANRDPRRWDRPDAFDLDRDPSGHVGFGMGIHQCVGQHVARLEATAVLGALLERVAEIAPAGRVRHHPNNTLRGFESVPVTVTLDRA